MYLTERTPYSFDCWDCTPAELATELQRRGLTVQSPRSIAEAFRATDNRRGLVVGYHSGTLTVQGPLDAVERLRQLLADLVVDGQPGPLSTEVRQ